MQKAAKPEIRSTSVSRRALLQATLAGSAASIVGTAPAVRAARAPARQSGTKIAVLVPTFVGAGNAFMEDQAKEFASQTGIEVEMQFLKFEQVMEKQTTLVAAESGEVDVFGTHYAQIGRFGEGMVPLNELAARDGIIASDYITGSFDALTVNGNLLAIPFTYDVRALYYRTDLFEEAGITAPPATWDELVEVAQKVNHPPDVYGFLQVGRGDPALREYSDRLWENGGDYLEAGLQPSRPIWNQPAGVEALTFMRDLIWEYEVSPPGTASYGWEENAQLFAAGQAAISKQWGPSGMEDPQQSTIIGKYSIAPLTHQKTSRTTVVCHARGINKYSEHQDAAWEYVKYVTSAEQLFKGFEAVSWRPAQVAGLEMAKDSAVGIDQLNLEVSLTEAQDGYTWPLFPQFSEVQPILWGEIEKVLSQQKEPQEALDYAAAQAEEIFKRDGLI